MELGLVVSERNRLCTCELFMVSRTCTYQLKSSTTRRSPVLREGRIILSEEMWRWWETRGKRDWGKENKVAAFKRADAAAKRKTCQAVNSLMRHSIFGNAAGAPL